MNRALRVGWALPAVLASALVAGLPGDVRPPVAAWVAGTAVLATVPCLVVRRRAGVVALAALGTALGMLVQLRLGVPAGRLALLGAAGSALVTVGTVAARSPRIGGRLDDPGVLRVVVVASTGLAVALRVVTVLGPAPASGTLPLLGVQVGELTRNLLTAGLALAAADPLLRGRLRVSVDRRFLALAAGLGLAGLGVLVAVRDLGPAVLVVVGAGAAVVHARGLRARWVAVVAVLVAFAAPLLWASSVLRTRVAEVVHPGPQLQGALTAAWSGGLVGPGPGRSGLVEGVPAIGSDYAVAALVADLGALVVLPVLLGLLLAELHLVRTAAGRRGPRASLATALATVLVAQAGWSALGAVGVLPLTGLNQPFLGVSGASLTTCALVLGVVLGLVDGPAPAGVVVAPGGRAVLVGAVLATRCVGVLLVAAVALLVVSPRNIGDAEQLRMPRGTLWTSDGQVIATDVGGARTYPSGGRYSDLGFERRNDTHRGVEAVDANVLTCGGRLGPLDLPASLLHPVCRTADVVTTIDSRAQAAVAGALAGGSAGEGMLVDARTGAVLALDSTSSTTPDAGSVARSVTGPPGSTIKLITASAALLDGVDFSGAPTGMLVGDDGSRLGNDGGAVCPGTDAATALAYSCNSVFGWAADQVGAAGLDHVARTWFGADQPFRLDGLEVEGLTLGDVPTTSGPLARTGIGQESVRSSVPGIALATAVVANGGSTTPWPHVVAATCPGGDPEPASAAPVVGPPLPARVADVVRAGMREAVTAGTARHLDTHGRDVIAKTGTAQLSDGGVDSWITAVVDGRWVLTLVVHHVDREGVAVDAASRVLAALPPTSAPPICPTPKESTS